MRRNYFRMSCVIALIVLAGMTAFAITFVGHHNQGVRLAVGNSLTDVPPNGASILVRNGGSETFGLQVLTLRDGAEPVTVTAVHIGGAKGLVMTGARLAGPDRGNYEWVGRRGFPPPRHKQPLVPAEGQTISAARRGWQLLVGLDITSSVTATFTSIRVQYRIDGRGQELQQTFPTTFVACTQTSQLVQGRCPEPPAT
jgi:hypothetical protein